jgi:hypothetical protein
VNQCPHYRPHRFFRRENAISPPLKGGRLAAPKRFAKDGGCWTHAGWTPQDLVLAITAE